MKPKRTKRKAKTRRVVRVKTASRIGLQYERSYNSFDKDEDFKL